MPARRSTAMVAPLRPPVASAAAWASWAAFDDTGGLISGDELAMCLRDRVSQPLSLVAQWIVRREVVHLFGRGGYVLPLFQFDPVTMMPCAHLADVLAERRAASDDRAVLDWFLRPHPLLRHATPAATLCSDGEAVVEAARRDRPLLSSC